MQSVIIDQQFLLALQVIFDHLLLIGRWEPDIYFSNKQVDCWQMDTLNFFI